MKKWLVLWTRKVFGSALFLGYVPLMPGTVGALAVVVLLWFFKDSVGLYFTPAKVLTFWMIYLACLAIAVFLSNNAKETFGANDPKQIVIDECVGQLITFFLVPLTWRALLLGFVLFRFFDIVKPYPVHKFEEIEDGVGIVMDDVVSGVLANVSLLFILWAYHGVRSYL